MKPELVDKVNVAFVHVVGPIGAGKSTMIKRAQKNPVQFITLLAQSPSFAWLCDWTTANTVVETAAEDPTKWKSVSGESYLDLMYADPKQHATDFQGVVMIDSISSARQAVFAALRRVEPCTKNILIVTDGCINTGCQVFAQNCRESGFISDEQWEKYFRMFQTLEKSWAADLECQANHAGVPITVSVRGTVYLCTPFEETLTRIKERGRECEQVLPQTYLRSIYDRHDYLMKSADYHAGPVLRVVDTRVDEESQFTIIKDE